MGKPKVIRKPTLVYLVTVQEYTADNGHPQGYSEIRWNLMEMLAFRRFKQTVVSYGMHSPL